MRIDSSSAMVNATSAAVATPVAAPAASLPSVRIADPIKASTPSASEQAQADSARIDAAIEAAHQFLHPVASNLKFVRDESSGRILVRLIDSETQKVLRQIPSEEMLAINKALDRMQGLMVHLKV